MVSKFVNMNSLIKQPIKKNPALVCGIRTLSFIKKFYVTRKRRLFRVVLYDVVILMKKKSLSCLRIPIELSRTKAKGILTEASR